MTAEGLQLPADYEPQAGDRLRYECWAPDQWFECDGVTVQSCGFPKRSGRYQNGVTALEFLGSDQWRLIGGPSFDELTAEQGVASTRDGGDESRPFDAIRISEDLGFDGEGAVVWQSHPLMVAVDKDEIEFLSVTQDFEEVVFTAAQFAALVEAAGLLGFTP